MWYQQQLQIPANWNEKRILLHFGGVDYTCEAYIDNLFIGTLSGGTATFSFDITNFVKAGQPITWFYMCMTKRDQKFSLWENRPTNMRRVAPVTPGLQASGRRYGLNRSAVVA